MRHLAGDEGEGAFDQGEQRAVAIAVGVVRIVVERHARIGDQIERGAVGKRDAARRAGAGLDHVALEHGVADMKRDRDAVAHHGDIADDFFDFADRVGRRGRLRLRIMSRRRRSGEQIDRVGRQDARRSAPPMPGDARWRNSLELNDADRRGR